MVYRVMLADDEPIMRKALLTLANWQDMECEVVYTAADGEEAIANLEKAVPDILITDVRMPGKSGIDLARYIWEKELPVKVIILTGYADFSYAQAALKYNVVDYVIKEGVFDGLVDAVQKAKDGIARERRLPEEEGVQLRTENFLKALFDGSLYEPQEIRKIYENASFLLSAEGYVIIALRFRVQDENKKRGGKTIYESLTNFFSMVFGEKMIGAVPVERDTFALVAACGKFREGIMSQCGQIIDMMDNFMKLCAYIGVSGQHKEIVQMKGAFDEALEALEYSFIDEASKINFYQDRCHMEEMASTELTRMLKLLYSEIANGNAEGARAYFMDILDIQKKERCSAYLIRNTGLQIQSQCGHILAEYEKTIKDVTGLGLNISRGICECRFLKDYQELLCNIIIKTAETVHIMVNRKKLLIQECEKFIEDNYDKNIIVADVAKYVGASPSYLSRVFKEMTGHTIIATLNQKKLDKAKEYLENTDMKIYEIAEALGFEHTTYFSHFFKKYAKVSPKDYKGGR